MLSIGVDPGVSGGVCLLSTASKKYPDGVIDLFPVPTRPGPGGTGRVVDGRDLADRLIVGIRSYSHEYPGAIIIPTVERVWAMSREGVKSVFTFGKATGTVIGVLEALLTPVREVTPHEWQFTVLGKDPKKKAETKELALRWARATYPRQSLLATPRSSVPHPGMVDALAIARYGFVTHDRA